MTTPALPSPAAAARVPAWLGPVLGMTAVLAIATPAFVVRLVPSPPRLPHRLMRQPVKVVPPAELPPVEPVSLQDLTPDDARAINATIPFVGAVGPGAVPYRFVGTADDRARAVDCLAAATLYEAGDDVEGERAVAQVVLNRLRHPAFPKTVCGVVFQGAERTTGCQFTFTCDGALVRHDWAAAAWSRAREVASTALSGAVDKPVGYATHYHTDWVVPYWSASLDKIAAVGSHLFYRWTGWWGTPAAFRRHPGAVEPVIAQLSRISPAHDGALMDSTDVVLAANGPNGMPAATGPVVAVTSYMPVTGDPDAFLITLPRTITPDVLPAFARAVCGDRVRCKVMGWTDAARTPRALPLAPAAMNAMAFSYLHDETVEFDKPLWNCRVFPRSAGQCMKRQLLASAPPPASPSPPRDPYRSVAPVSFTLKPVGDALAGVRRKNARPTDLVGEMPATTDRRRTDAPGSDPR